MVDPSNAIPPRLESAVRDFHAHVQAWVQWTDALEQVLPNVPEGPLHTAAWNLVEGYLAALDSAYGIAAWLEWWWLECALGATPLAASPRGGELRLIDDIDALVRLIVEDVAYSEISP